MRDYGKVSPKFWAGNTGKDLRAMGPEALLVASYLMTAPLSNMLGLYYLPKVMIAHETALGFEGASKGLRGAIEAGFCAYDESTETVWVFEMARWQIGESLKAGDNRCIGIQNDYNALHENPYLAPFFDRYAPAYHLSKRRDFSRKKVRASQGASKPLRSQEQEQEQEQEQARASSLRSDLGIGKPTPPASPPVDPPKPAKTPTNLAARRAERLSQVTEDAIGAYNRLLAKPTGKLRMVRPNVGRKKRQAEVQRCWQVASEICLDRYGDKRVTPEFWDAHFGACSDDPFTSGEGPYTGEHANWRPDFEYLTRPATVLKVFEKAVDDEEQAQA